MLSTEKSGRTVFPVIITLKWCLTLISSQHRLC